MKSTGSQDIAVDIPFAGGMAEGAAPLVFNGPLVDLAEDCVITKEGSYRRFPGGSLPTPLAGVSGGSRGLSVFDSTLVQHTVEGPYQYNETPANWRASNPKGFVPTQVITDLTISQSAKSVYNTQLAVSSGGYELYVWDEMLPTPTDDTLFGSGFTGKGFAIRDPLGGWSLKPTFIAASNPGHQIIAIGTTFLIGYTTGSGFQVFTLPQATTTLTFTQIVTNATGSSITSTYALSACHDVCLSTAGTSAYFLVAQYSGSANYYVYTVNTAGQVGTASNGANPTLAAWALCVDNAKVYVACANGNVVSLSKIAEASISAGTAATVIGDITLEGTGFGRVRIAGLNNTGITVAVEGKVNTPSTDLTLEGDPPVAVPSYNSLPTAPYVEMGFLPTSDIIASYPTAYSRAFAHGYVLGSGFTSTANRGNQILLVYHGLVTRGALWQDADGESNGFTYAYALWEQQDGSGPYKGAIWVEMLMESVLDEEGVSYVDQWQLRSLARVAWDTAFSDWTLGTFPSAPANTDRNVLRYRNSSLSRVTELKLALRAQVDVVSNGLRRVELDTSPLPPIASTTHGDLQFDGGCQHVWDGQHSFENTPHFPPIVGWVPSILVQGDPQLIPIPYPASITSCAPGYTDTWSFHWEWVDGNGYLHRSAVATVNLVMAATFSTGGSYHYNTASCGGFFGVLPPLSANDKLTYRGLRLVVAMLPGDGSTDRSVLASKYSCDWTNTFAAFTSLASTTTERVALGTVYYEYSGVTVVLKGFRSNAGGGYLYTDGGVLEAFAPPTPASLTSTRDRLWLISADNRRQLFYTKPLEAGVAPEFNPQLTVDIPADSGEGVAVLTVDDKPVVLCERGLYFIAGDGPNALGTQGDFQAQIVQSDTGCTHKNSTAKCDYGVFFQGERGIYLLDRGLNVSLVSQGVQDRATGEISKAVAVPKEQQIRFGLSAGDILVYHYALKAWTVLNRTAYDAVIWDGSYTRVFDDANMYIASTDESAETDPESDVTMLIRTSWVKADKMQGFARFKRVQVLHSQYESGSSYAYGPITVTARFNYEDENGYSETATWSSTDRKPASTRSQIELRLGKQKSESIQLDISCPNKQAAGEGFDYYYPISLEGLTLTVGTTTNTQFRHLRQQTKN